VVQELHARSLDPPVKTRVFGMTPVRLEFKLSQYRPLRLVIRVSARANIEKLKFLRKWWNWQTHHLEVVAPKGVGVQIPPSAPEFVLAGHL
jgi:hypothetical protein